MALLVRDYDESIAWFVDRLGFTLVEDTRLSATKRWVVIEAPGGGSALLLARTANAAQDEAVGTAAGGRVAFFLHTDAFDREHARLTTAGVRFLETPRDEPYGRVAVFADLYGNRWDLIGPA